MLLFTYREFEVCTRHAQLPPKTYILSLPMAAAWLERRSGGLPAGDIGSHAFASATKGRNKNTNCASSESKAMATHAGAVKVKLE